MFLGDLSDDDGNAPNAELDGAIDDRTIASPDAPDDAMLVEIEAGPPPADVPKDTLDCALPNLVLCDGFEDADLLDASVGDWSRTVSVDAATALTDASASGARSFLIGADTPASANEVVFLSADNLNASAARVVIVEGDVFVDSSAAAFGPGHGATIVNVQPAEAAGFSSDDAPRASVTIGELGAVTARIRTFGNDPEKTIALPTLGLGAWHRIFLFIRFAEKNGVFLAKVDGVQIGDLRPLATVRNAANATRNSVALALNRRSGTPATFVRFDNVHVRIGTN